MTEQTRPLWIPVEEGIDKLVEWCLGGVQPNPVVIVLNGMPNSGKTYVGRRVAERLFALDKWAIGGSVEDERSYRLADHTIPDAILLSYCGLSYPTAAEAHTHRFIGKKPDRYVLIDNPRLTGGVRGFADSDDISDGFYDLQIVNPSSIAKMRR